jgi:sorting and assembly machinery component 37
MSSASGSYAFILHTTPPFGGLPASDPESIYLSAAFQLAAPGRFALQIADWGDNGGTSGEPLEG